MGRQSKTNWAAGVVRTAEGNMLISHSIASVLWEMRG